MSIMLTLALKRISIARVILYLILAIIALLWMTPILWALATSFKQEQTLFRMPIEWIPDPFTLENYIFILTTPDLPILRWYFNSIFTASMTTIVVLITNSFAAFAFARKEFPGRNILFAIVIATMLIPGHILLVPLYLLMDKLDLIDTYIGLMVPVATSAFGVFLLRQFFLTFPNDLEDAARIDGLGSLGILIRIIIPNSVPALSALSIFTFLSNWNAFIWPLVITNSLFMKTIPIGLAVFQNEYHIQYHLVMGAAMIAALPLLVVFYFFQTRFIQGITLTGLKG